MQSEPPKIGSIDKELKYYTEELEYHNNKFQQEERTEIERLIDETDVEYN
ncbi:hypothetical protein HYFRA_00011596 [Hymenoscyphus fraxineus]|uniref:Uncharacterized protein n=1 Tax=Hymenoscyphus fraxineus TaxID=746836 RepID=A0A9N9L862_9HELO|nr:hypothetical protein HYFRA_00011596 [Hymenoscyphus fraxineus]